MSNVRRFGVVLVALILAVGAFFVFRPEETTPRQDKTGQDQAVEERSGSSTREADDPDRATPAESEAEVIRIAGGKPVGRARTVTFSSGEEVRLAFRSSTASEVHIHGYDRYVDVKPGRTARVRFEADSEGSFEVEDHGSGELLARLEVEP